MRITIETIQANFLYPLSTGHRHEVFRGANTLCISEYGGGTSWMDTTYFMFVTKPNTDPPSPWLWESFILPVVAGEIRTGGPDEGKLIYESFITSAPPGPDVLGVLIECELEQESNEPGCKWVLAQRNIRYPSGT